MKSSCIEELAMNNPHLAQTEKVAPNFFYKIADAEGVARLYEESPEHCLRLYLTKQLPGLESLQRTVDVLDRSIKLATEEIPGLDSADEDESRMAKSLRESQEEDQELVPFWQADRDYFERQADFTKSLLMEGYEPYTLQETTSFVKDYLVGLLAEHPELSPTNLIAADVPDKKAEIGHLLLEAQQRDHPEDN
jgi:hypothetical protein